MIKVPDEVYVVSQNRVEHEYPIPGNWNVKNEINHNFGFLHPHEPKLKADAKRKKTQHEWAYGSSYDWNNGRKTGAYQKPDGEWWHAGNDYKWDPVTYKQIVTPFDRPIDPMYAPRIWSNVALTGFRLIDTVNRYRGNKLFKVLDPRGVEFEITVQSLFHILQEGVVQNGLIISPCVWKSGKNLIVANSSGEF
jgi:hypothetical protein